MDSPARPEIVRHLDECAHCRVQKMLLNAYAEPSVVVNGHASRSQMSLSQALEMDAASARSTFPPEVGGGTGRYHKQKLVGSGPHGKLFAVFDRERERRVALKSLDRPPRLELKGIKQTLLALGHPHVGQILEVHDWEGPVYTRVFYGGMDLVEVMATEPGTTQLNLWFGQLASALAALHGAGLAHGGVKPENVRVTPQGRLVLVDAGIGSLEARSRYRAPELRDGEASPAADWYAVGYLFADGLHGDLGARLRSKNPAERPGAADVLGALLVQRDHEEFGSTRYRYKGLLGEGGMGKVYRVYDPVLKRAVALKIMSAEMVARADASARFSHEAQITAQLQHPGIVPVHEMAQLEDGTPYYTMKEIPGTTLKVEASEEGTLDLNRLIEAFRRVCEAMSYAHSNKIVHRDLKPENVMIGDFGEVLVVDWGLAKVLGAAAAEAPKERVPVGFTSDFETDRTTDGDHTRTGWLAGTPGYMPVEQSTGRIADIGPHTDVFALGSILFEILTTKLAFPQKNSEARNRAAQDGDFISPQALNTKAPAELAAIAMKALQPRIADRYPSALEMERDIEAWQTGGIVSAYPYSPIEDLERKLRPYQGSIAAGSIGVLAVAAIGMFAVFQAGNRMQMQAQWDVETGQLLVEKAQLAIGAEDRIPAEVYAAGAVSIADRPEARGILARTGRTWYPELAHHLRTPCLEMGVGAMQLRCDDVSWNVSPDGTEWTATSAQVVDRVERGQAACDDAAEALDFFKAGRAATACSADGKQLAVAADDRIDVWELVPEPLQIASLQSRNRGVESVAWSADGEQLASWGSDGIVRIWDFDASEEIARLPGHPELLNLRYIGSDLLAMSAADTVQVWDVSPRGGVEDLDVRVEVARVDWTASDELLTLNRHGAAQTFDQSSGKRKNIRWIRRIPFLAVAPDPSESELLAVGRIDGTIQILDKRLKPQWSGMGHEGGTTALIWRDGLMISGGADGGVSTWNPETGAALQTWLAPGGAAIRDLAYSDSARLLARTDAGELLLFEGGEPVPLDLEASSASAISPDGSRVGVGREHGTAFIAELDTGKQHPLVGHTQQILAIAFSGDGSLVATASMDHIVRVWDAHTGAELARLAAHQSAATGVAFSRDLGTLASSDRTGKVHLWDTEPFRVDPEETVHRVTERYGASLVGLNLDFDWR